MAYDALSLSLLCEEMNDILTGGKITKIYQPERDEIVLFIFNKQTHKLILSANASVNRIHITEMPTDNPKTAPAFCMLLRKHLTNATITGITQMPYERVLDFSLEGSDDLGYRNKMHLIFELTGKTSNTVLTDGDYVILDSIKHLPQTLESTRVILAGAKYTFFPPQNKLQPFDIPRIREFLSKCATPLRKSLTENLLGVSQTTVNEVLWGLDENDHTIVNNEKVIQGLMRYKHGLENKQPNVVFQKGVPVEVCPFNYLSKKGEKVFYPTLNKAHDSFYFLTDKVQRFNDKAKSITTVVKNAVSRTEKKLAIQRQSVLEAQNREMYKQYGDLILSNLWQIKQGQTVFSCQNYYDGSTAEIALDATLTPQQNAQAYYKKYRKLKSSAQHNQVLVQENEKMLDYLLTIRQNLRYCTETEDLQEIRSELVSLGLIKENTSKKHKELPVKPLKYNVHGFCVYVGKNNVQNNHVTFKIAKNDDIWLHTQKIHSSHVIIVAEGKNVPDEVIVGAAEICAFFSQASEGSKIPVDYTQRQNVKKPPHSPLGFVVYNTYNTLLVNPNRHTEWLEQQ